ncbi:hypothetical protein M6B38_390245 [Iris pallida]|uniref:Uncharacterized protein n=1 Tax=Iris pallida TaxID=29817 RepID=A0AAX6G1Q2_IRIPA|nr:hypothetical protein M6B38_390245 [Iris pallida]
MSSAIRDIIYGTVELRCTSEIVAKLASHCKEVGIFICCLKGKCIHSVGYSRVLYSVVNSVFCCKSCNPF